MDIKNKNLETIYKKLWDLTIELSDEYTPLQVAGVLTAQALTIYKTVLSEEEFNSMVDTISTTRDKVKELTFPSIQ